MFIENVSLPSEVEAVLDKRTSMGIVGDLGKYAQFQAAEAMRAAAETPGSAMGTMVGVGMGGAAMAPWGAGASQPSAMQPPPPPPPPEKLWHIAEGGATQGPFSRADLGRMAQEGRMTRATLVWTQGAAGWTQAGAFDELAQLFTVAPPPPPAV